MHHIGMGAAVKKMLLDHGFRNVIDVNLMESSGSRPLVVLKIKNENCDDGKKVRKALAQKFIGKIAIAVDDDINIYDLDHVMWAVSYRAQPHRDVEVVDTPLLTLDPSVSPPEHARGPVRNVRSTALQRPVDRCDHALALPAALVAKARILGTRGEDLEAAAVSALEFEGPLVWLLIWTVDS